MSETPSLAQRLAQLQRDEIRILEQARQARQAPQTLQALQAQRQALQALKAQRQALQAQYQAEQQAQSPTVDPTISRDHTGGKEELERTLLQGRHSLRNHGNSTDMPV